MPDDVSLPESAAPHDHTTCPTCDQIYRDGYNTGRMHASRRANTEGTIR